MNTRGEIVGTPTRVVRSCAFSALRDAVLGDPDAQMRLRATRDWESFLGAARQLATERGVEISSEDVERARADARRVWSERGI